MAFYRVDIGTGTAWLDSYILETDYHTTDYGALVDALIDYLVERGDSRILYGPEYEWDADYETIHLINDPDLVIYPDEFVQGGNEGDILHHYGQFNIEEIDESEVDYDTPIIQVDKW